MLSLGSQVLPWHVSLPERTNKRGKKQKLIIWVDLLNSAVNLTEATVAS